MEAGGRCWNRALLFFRVRVKCPLVGRRWIKGGCRWWRSREPGTGDDDSRAHSCSQGDILHGARSSDGVKVEVSLNKDKE